MISVKLYECSRCGGTEYFSREQVPPDWIRLNGQLICADCLEKDRRHMDYFRRTGRPMDAGVAARLQAAAKARLHKRKHVRTHGFGLRHWTRPNSIIRRIERLSQATPVLEIGALVARFHRPASTIRNALQSLLYEGKLERIARGKYACI